LGKKICIRWEKKLCINKAELIRGSRERTGVHRVDRQATSPGEERKMSLEK